MTKSGARDEGALNELVSRAKAGDREALEAVIAALQDDVFRLALRMTADPRDAEDASQEILVKIVTKLDGFRGEASLRTWAYRIAVRHILDRRKSRVEELALDFERFGAELLDGLAAEPDPDPAAAREVKLGCTLAMLTCLDREHRLAFVLCDVFDLSYEEACAICETGEPTLRQRLSRARRILEAFTTSYCGLVRHDAPCHCSKRVVRAAELGRIQRAERTDEDLAAAASEMEALHTTAELMRSHAAYRAPERLVHGIRDVLGRKLRMLSE